MRHLPSEISTAARTRVSATRIPASSPNHTASPGPVVAGENALWITLLYAACSAIGGQMLPVSNRNRAMTKPAAVAETMNTTTASSLGLSPKMTPVTMSGRCHRPQISPLTNTGRGTPASINLVSM